MKVTRLPYLRSGSVVRLRALAVPPGEKASAPAPFIIGQQTRRAGERTSARATAPRNGEAATAAPAPFNHWRRVAPAGDGHRGGIFMGCLQSARTGGRGGDITQ